MIALVCGVAGPVSAYARIESANPPTGIYCSCPPTSATSHSVLPDVAALPYVDGTLLRIGWNLLEPSPGVYDWSLLDAELARAEQYDTDVALAVVLGQHTPAWLEQEGAQIFSYVWRDMPGEVVVPWDETYLDHWTSFISDIGERYDSHPRIKLVHITHSSFNGFEMQLPATFADWLAIGYTTQRHADSWVDVIDAFNSAFPSKPLDVDVHPVLESDAIAQAVVTHGTQSIGDRFGVLAAWWTQNNADNVYTDMFGLLTAAACDTFASVQVARSETVHGSDIFGQNGLNGTLNYAMTSNISYIEIWNSDLLNPTLQPMIEAFAADFSAYERCATACLPDTNNDGTLSPADFSAWVAAFNTQAPACNQNDDGSCTSADFSAWVTNYNAGCP